MKPILFGNWKMNHTMASAEAFFGDLADGLPSGWDSKVELGFAVPYLSLAACRKWTEPLGITIAAQNLHQELRGAFTGEVSVEMLSEVGVSVSLIGHSERRQYFGESDQIVAKKLEAAQKAGFKAIVCVGESLEENESGRTMDVISKQLEPVLKAVGEPSKLVIAYEPVWAIGTGRSATAEGANQVHREVKRILAAKFPGAAIPVLYGGSVKPDNVGELLGMDAIDGALVGGASLKAQDVIAMINQL